MNSSYYRKEARNKLTGKWDKAVLITLCYIAITSIFNILGSFLPGFLYYPYSLFIILISIPISYGLTISFFKLYKNDDVSYFDFLTFGFNNFERSWEIFFNIILKTIVTIIVSIFSYILIVVGIDALILYKFSFPNISSMAILIFIDIILFIIPIIIITIKSYLYQLSSLIAIENPDLSPKDAVMKSEELMTGNRAKLFILQLSFFGWAFLGSLVCGIGLLWVFPYIEFAVIAFYIYLSGNTTSDQFETVQSTTEVKEESTQITPISEGPAQETIDESNTDPIQSNDDNQDI